MGKVFDWIDSRFGIKNPHKRLFQRPIPPGVNYSYCFGGAAFTLFLMSAVTGLLLSVSYIPSESDAYKSIVRIHDDVHLGWLVRSVHKWSANLLIVFMILHAIRVFVTRAYRPPRELNWIAGVFTFVLSMGSGFTGYLLPWDQRAYWATVVGTSMAGTVPIVGGILLIAVRGGPDVDGTTLIRFYSMHVLYLPLTMSLILWAHFHMIKKQGIAGGL
ncbi:MAG: cytochrome b N-terminal domain-containing protein [Thermodesulfovibrionales bacterium]|jgi:quinol-cytochrome oxidoreductase complex cytochrome b subunit